MMGIFKRLPVTLVEGRGVRVFDDAGREYLDLVAGVATNALGHRHPALVEAIAGQADRLIHASNNYYTELQVELARMLVERAFPSRVSYANGGAEANETALKIVRKWGKVRREGCYEIIVTERAFHGRTIATVAAGGKEAYSAPYAPLPPGFVRVPYGDLDAIRRATGPNTAAVMLEPIMGEVGVITPPDDYLPGVRGWCDEQDLLLVLDEIQTGIGRTGRWFAHQHHGITPDVMTLAKGLAGGVPIGACLASPRADVFEVGDHGNTFGGNPLACAASLAVLRTIEAEGLVEHAAAMEPVLRDALAALPGADFVRGRGLMQAVVFVDPVAKDFQACCLQEGVIVNAIDDHTVRTVPPLIITAAEIEEAAERMRRARRRQMRWPGRPGGQDEAAAAPDPVMPATGSLGAAGAVGM
jgi:acetylornithine aminotransferase/acetylornithine/N-succinyldiaminopimelate aminotransferase